VAAQEYGMPASRTIVQAIGDARPPATAAAGRDHRPDGRAQARSRTRRTIKIALMPPFWGQPSSPRGRASPCPALCKEKHPSVSTARGARTTEAVGWMQFLSQAKRSPDPQAPSPCRSACGPEKELQATWADVVSKKITEDEAKKRIKLRARGAQPGNQNARKEKGEQENKGDRITIVSRGTDPAYLTARMERDAETKPRVAAELAAFRRGDHKSIKAAARAAGIVKTPSPFAQVQRLWPKLTDEEKDAIRRMP
jgi:hypothetical protein